MQNLRDSNILQDFTLWVDSIGKIGECPGFQPPEINIQTEEFRGGGMDGTVDIPLGLEKIEFDFDLHTYDQQIWENIGFGPGSMNVPVTFRGYLLTPNGGEKTVIINTKSLIKGIKPSKVQSGQKFEMNVALSCHYYEHKIDNKVINLVDVFMKMFVVNGSDRSKSSRSALGFSY